MMHGPGWLSIVIVLKKNACFQLCAAYFAPHQAVMPASMPEPNFFIIGAAKAATTALSLQLEQHPEAAIVQYKEPHFFSYDHVYALGWERYLGLYNHCRDQKAIGDASTSYSRIRYHPKVIDRIKQHAPDAKIIYMVRHPIKRMESAYVEHMATSIGQVYASINDAVKRQSMIIDSSRYWEVFNAYRRKFDESKIKVVWFEEYISDTNAVFQDVCRFLEINDKIVPNLDEARTNNRENATDRMARLGRGNVDVDQSWDDETRRWVVCQLGEDSRKFLEYFHRPADYWGELFPGAGRP
jgi:hypothetical protein